jgi:hypothetical protein
VKTEMQQWIAECKEKAKSDKNKKKKGDKQKD